jgi:glycosyltransferase involved in cell wall biosynthesis
MISIIIPTCLSFKEIKKQIKEIQNNTIIDYKLIVTCQQASAAWNRNFGLDCSNSEYIIMIDDDISDFKKGWAKTLINTLKDDSICMVSGRCMQPDKVSMSAVGHCCYFLKPDIIDIPKLKEGILPTSIIAFRRTSLRFDINYKGASFEDADFCFQMYNAMPEKRFVVNNKCKVIHTNERKGYGGKIKYDTRKIEEDINLIENRKYFYRKWNVS